MSEQLQRLAQGRTAEIFAWPDGQVLKLYRPFVPAAWVMHETTLSRLVAELGIPAPAVGETMTVDGRPGTIYERIDGPSLLDTLFTQPWRLTAVACQLAELQFRLHTVSAPALPPLHASLTQRIIDAPNLTDNLRSHALQTLEQLPDGDKVCHGDFHPGNIILAPRGPVIIDWMTATAGNPLADVARTSMMLRYGEVPPGALKSVISLLRALLHRNYLNQYRQRFAFSPDDLRAWMLPVMAARLWEDIAEERPLLLAALAQLSWLLRNK